MNRLESELNIALAAVVDACKLAEAVGRSLTGEGHAKKDDRSPVTVADFGVQAVIHHHLTRALPDDPIVAEEDSGELSKPDNAPLRALVNQHVKKILPGISGDEVTALIDRGSHAGGGAGRFWTLDPIDGTKGFLRGDQYAVALSLIENGVPVLGILGCPRLGSGSIYAARSGLGASVFALDGSGRSDVTVSARALPSLAVFCESFESGHSAHDVSSRVTSTLGSTAAPRRMDSQAKYAVVAAGEGDVYLRLPTKAGYEEKIWDHAAGALLVEAAGGRVTDIHGAPLDFSRGRTLSANKGIVATNAKFHDAVLAAIRTAQS
jgi:HAL2 family 3'(2'),5'-bisphosphate nucleotidase